MSKFKVGDIIRRIRPSHWPDRYGVLGMEYTVLAMEGHNPIIMPGGEGAIPSAFELVSAAPDDPEVRDLEEKITSLTKSLAASHIANTNLRKEIVSISTAAFGMREAADQVTDLTVKVERLKEECGKKEVTLACRNARINDLSQEVKQKDEQVKEQTKKVIAREHELGIVRGQLSTAQYDLSNARCRADTHVAQIGRRDTRITELLATIEEKTTHVTFLTHAIKQKEAEITILRNKDPDLFIVASLRDVFYHPVLTMLGSFRKREDAIEHLNEKASTWTSPLYLIEGRASLKAGKDSTVYLERL